MGPVCRCPKAASPSWGLCKGTRLKHNKWMQAKAAVSHDFDDWHSAMYLCKLGAKASWMMLVAFALPLLWSCRGLCTIRRLSGCRDSGMHVLLLPLGTAPVCHGCALLQLIIDRRSSLASTRVAGKGSGCIQLLLGCRVALGINILLGLNGNRRRSQKPTK